MLTSRQKLAQILNFRLTEKKLPASYVASRCHVAIPDVLQWLAGTLVPNSGEWVYLNTYILRNIAPDALWQAAKQEQDEDHRQKLRSLDKANLEKDPSKIVTNVGDKLREAGVSELVPKIAPESPKRRMYPDRLAAHSTALPGAKTRDAREERRQFAKGIILQRPGIKIGGDDGLQVLIRQRFGIGIDPSIVPEIKREIANEHKHTEIPAPEQPPAKLIVPPAPVVVSQEPNQKNLTTGVNLILGSIPNLQQFTLTVRENGEATIEYRVRKIEEQTGSLIVRLK